jgi:hypothetical protein
MMKRMEAIKAGNPVVVHEPKTDPTTTQVKRKMIRKRMRRQLAP